MSPSSPANTGNATSLRARRSACSVVSPRATPGSTSRAGPIARTVSREWPLSSDLIRLVPPLPDPACFGLPPGTVVATPGEGEILYRLIGRGRPRPTDFRSNHDKGRPPMPRETALLRCGVSMFDSEMAARSRARRTPVLLAAVTLESERGFSLAKTAGPSHYTVWGDPEVLAACARDLTD